MPRLIDADVATKRFREWLESPHDSNAYNSGYDDAIWHILEVIDHTPALTQPNDVLTCEGCVYFEELTAPCAYCARMKREVDYYRPPEEKEKA